MNDYRIPCSLALVALAMLAALALRASAETPGIAAEPPSQGPVIEADGGYMVPYTATIPGTNVSYQMVPIPGGEFLLGSPADEPGRGDDEGPQVTIRVEPFWMGKFEVTWAEYKAFMAMYDAFKKLQMLAVRRDEPAAADAEQQRRLVQAHAFFLRAADEEAWDVDAVTSATPLYLPDVTYAAGDGPDQPAVTMTQYAARQYTKWLSGITGRHYRLPSEAEWEYAARAGTTTAYSFGDDAADLDRFAWLEENADYETHPVGSKQPNPWGLHDMHGNVAEWTLDQYDPDGYQQLASGAQPIAARDAIRWPTKLYPRVIRGGSWLDGPETLRSAARHSSEEQQWKLADPNIPLSPWWFTEEPASGVGMRIIRPLAALTDEEQRRVWDADVEDLRHDVLDRLREGRAAAAVLGETLPQAVQAAEQLDKEP